MWMDDLGQTQQSPEPIRMCAWTRRRQPKSRLLRMVLDPEGRPQVDLSGKAPGRGLHVSPDREVILQALTAKGLRRLFKGWSGPEPEAQLFLESVATRLEARMLDHLGLARRAGKLVIGLEEVSAALGRSASSVVVLSRDASERTARQVRKAAGTVPVLRFGSSESFGARLGRGPTAVLGVLPSVFAERLSNDGERHQRLTNEGAREA
ncbi:MAG: DUF448 domain-containing protein [Myxococcota bacterium]